MKSQIDHLVVAAHNLQQGVEWCEATLGITPAAGGEHEKYGTHNRLFKIATPAFPVAYLEIIAINPDAVIEKKPPPTRAFGRWGWSSAAQSARWTASPDGCLPCPQAHFARRSKGLMCILRQSDTDKVQRRFHCLLGVW
jgi:hypothetical protein